MNRMTGIRAFAVRVKWVTYTSSTLNHDGRIIDFPAFPPERGSTGHNVICMIRASLANL